MILPPMNVQKHKCKIVRAVSFLALSLLVSILSGCFSDKEKIHFSDEGTQPRLATNSIAQAKPSLSKADQAKIELDVFAYLLTRHFWDDGDYSAIFLQGDEAEVATLQKQFPDHVPPIKPDFRAQLRPGFAPVDKDTGKPAMILSVDVNEPDDDGSVAAIGKWYAGGAVTGFYSFVLKKSGGDWKIQTPP